MLNAPKIGKPCITQIMSLDQATVDALDTVGLTLSISRSEALHFILSNYPDAFPPLGQVLEFDAKHRARAALGQA